MTKGITNRSDFKHVLSTSLPMQSYIPTTISGGGSKIAGGSWGGGYNVSYASIFRFNRIGNFLFVFPDYFLVFLCTILI